MTQEDANNITLARGRAREAYAAAVEKRDSAWGRLTNYRALIGRANKAVGRWPDNLEEVPVGGSGLGVDPPELPTTDAIRQALTDLANAGHEVQRGIADMRRAGVPRVVWERLAS